MALTPILIPKLNSPVYNPLIFSYSSTLTAQSNFEYRLNIEIRYIDPTLGTFTAWTEIAEIQQPPNPDGIAIFDIHKYLANELTYNLNPSLNEVVSVLNSGKIHLQHRVIPSEVYTSDLIWQFNKITKYTDGSGVERPYFNFVAPLTDTHLFNSYAGYTVKIVLDDAGNPAGETFHNQLFLIEDSASTTNLKTSDAFWNVTTETVYTESGTAQLISEVIIETAGTTTGTFNCFNGVLEWNEFPEWQTSTTLMKNYFTELTGHDAANFKFLSQIDPAINLDVLITDYVWLNGQAMPWKTDNGIVVETDNGKFFYDCSNEIADTLFTTTLQTFGLGPQNLINYGAPDIVLTGAAPAVDASTTFITFWFSDDAGLQINSAKYTFNIIAPCTKYEKYTLLFLDTLGSFIPVHFYYVSRKNLNISRTNYQKNIEPVTSGSQQTYNVYDRGTTNIDTTYTEVVSLTSDWLTDYQGSLIVSMLKSPAVYHLNSSGVIRAIDILTDSVEDKKVINDQLYNYNISFKYSNKNRTNI